MNQKPQDQSIVSQRLAWLQNHQVEIFMKSFEPESSIAHTIVATFLDVVPLGRTYFFILIC
jgi:hypothetical protein